MTPWNIATRRQFGIGAAASVLAGGAVLSDPQSLRASPAPSRLWSRSEGEGRDIVFVHGWSMDHRDEARVYEPVFARRSGWRRHYVDLPGMGRSAANPAIRDLDGMLDALTAWIRTIAPNRSVVLAGTSAGAYLALGALQRGALQIDGLLLRAPLIEPDNDRRDIDALRPIISDADVAATIPASERAAMGELMIQTPEYLAAMRAKTREAVSPAIAAADKAYLDPIRNDRMRYRLRGLDINRLPKFGRPALILTGRLDASVGYRDAWRLMPHMPRATFATLDRAEHGLPIDQQTVFGALVNDWLDRLEEDRAARS